MNKKIGFIGAGNMGEAIAGAVIRANIVPSSMVYMSDVSKERLDILKKNFGINIATDNFNLFSTCDIVVLAVKPQQMNIVLLEIVENERFQIVERKLIISIAAGIRIHKIEDMFYPHMNEASRKLLPIIRVMPNTPALVLSGISGMSANSNANDTDIQITKKILNSMGKVIEFQEDDLDAVTALSGSGPAYVFYLIESMTQGGIRAGLRFEDAELLTIETIKGAVRLMEERKESPESLRKKVTSPGGTTEAALKVLEGNSVRHSIIDAIQAAARRAKELSR